MSDSISLFKQAIQLLPDELRREAGEDNGFAPETLEEIRLRAGRRPMLQYAGGECFFGPDRITARDLEAVLERVTMGSPYTVRDKLNAGFVTAPGGFRIGITGSASVSGGDIAGFQSLSSLAIRVPHEVKGCASEIMGIVAPGGIFSSTLIVSPPGAGKTTLLRDMIRMLSDGEGVISGYRVALADERSEVASVLQGVPQMDVGIRTDILDACPKAGAVMMLLRSMNPEIISLDEITAPEDIQAIESAANCGVQLLATVHAEDMDDLRKRHIYIRLLNSGIFRYAVFITRENGKRRYSARRLGA